MPQSTLIPLLIALLLLQIHCAPIFNFADTGKSGSTVKNTLCNIQTTLDFKFSSNSIYSTPVLVKLRRLQLLTPR
jgi:hypothetical protein